MNHIVVVVGPAASARGAAEAETAAPAAPAAACQSARHDSQARVVVQADEPLVAQHALQVSDVADGRAQDLDLRHSLAGLVELERKRVLQVVEGVVDISDSRAFALIPLAYVLLQRRA